MEDGKREKLSQQRVIGYFSADCKGVSKLGSVHGLIKKVISSWWKTI